MKPIRKDSLALLNVIDINSSSGSIIKSKQTEDGNGSNNNPSPQKAKAGIWQEQAEMNANEIERREQVRKAIDEFFSSPKAGLRKGISDGNLLDGSQT